MGDVFGVGLVAGPPVGNPVDHVVVALDQARKGLDIELRRILDEPITQPEIDRAKAYLIGSQAVSLQRFGTQASMLSLEELYGLGAAHHLDYEKRIDAVGADDLSRIAKRIIRLDAPLTAIVK